MLALKNLPLSCVTIIGTTRAITASLVALKPYLTAKPARLAEDYRTIPLAPQALDAIGVTTDCLRLRLISGQARAS